MGCKISFMSSYIVVLVTVGLSEEAAKLGRSLVEERLAACVNCIGPIRSVYRWKGQIEEDEEFLLVVKTREDLFARLKAKVVSLHSYSVPEVIALPIVKGNEGYLQWLGEQLI